MPKRIIPEEVIAEFKAIEEVKQRGYTFDNLIIKDHATQVVVTCPTHGDFKVTITGFKRNFGCPSCSTCKKITQAECIEEFKKIELEKQRDYTFGNLVYINSHTKVFVTCPTHGDFSITPSKFKIGRGCPSCSGNKKVTQKECIAEFEKIETIKKRNYTFGSLVYINAKQQVLVTCPTHGDFPIFINNFKSGHGCAACAGLKKITQEECIQEFETIESDKKRDYTFENLVYINTKSKVLVTCPIHGDFPISPSKFKCGRGCPSCSKFGFQKDLSGIFYYVRVNKDGCEAYKPGITNRTIKERYPNDFEFMTVLRAIEFESGQEAYDFEQAILNDYGYAKWAGISLLKDGGNSELMKYDILNWDK